MSEVNESRTWREDHPSLINDAGIPYSDADGGIEVAAPAVEFGGVRNNVDGIGGSEADSWRFHAVEFAKGFAEMSVEFGKGCRDVVKQNIVSEDSFLARKLGGPCKKIGAKLSFLNEYLPEDRDPIHAWTVILFVSIIAVAALCVNNTYDTSIPLIKKLRIHPPNATHILLPDGRRMSYQEQGVSADRARFSIITSHSFLSSRLAGMPGLKESLLQEFGIRFITYDLPGFGESDPHPNRNLKSSALDMLHLSYAVGVTEKFWVLGYSGGSMHAWAALRYIPDRIEGAFMVAPMANPYDSSMTKAERHRTWEKWTSRRKLLYILARRFSRFLPYFFHRSFLSGNHGQIDKWLSLSLGKRDRDLVEDHVFQEFWQRDVEESVRQRNARPFVEEAVLLVSNWGFSLADLKVQKKRQCKGIMHWLKSIYSRAEEEMTGFLGPIHIWQGLEDQVVPPSLCDFVQRILPGAMVHKLLYEGHFTYFYFCDECHRQMLSTIFGAPLGPLVIEAEQAPMKMDNDYCIEEELASDDFAENAEFFLAQ